MGKVKDGLLNGGSDGIDQAPFLKLSLFEDTTPLTKPLLNMNQNLSG